MPEGAQPPQPIEADTAPKKGLAGVDLLSNEAETRSNVSRFEEYKVDEKEELQGDIPAERGGGRGC